MSNAPQIPYGYRQVVGQLQKGDGLWDGKRFRKVRKDYPYIGTREGIAIRLCEVVQATLPAVEPTLTLTDGNGNNPKALTRHEYETLKKMGMLWEFYPGAPGDWPDVIQPVIPETVAAHEEEWVEP